MIIFLHFVHHFVVVHDFCCSSFCCCSSFLLLFFVDCFLTPSLTVPWTIVKFLHPFCTFSQRITEWFATLSFLTLSRSFHSFTASFTSATVFSGHFLSTDVFYLLLHHRHFTCVYQGTSASRQFFIEICRASYCSSNTGLAHLFVWFTVIHHLYN